MSSTNTNTNDTSPTTTTTVADMSATKSPLKLTLILAATPSLGIGLNGTLPWPQLRKEMGYFARVTKHVPSKHLPQGIASNNEGRKIMNAVVMGRRTWDSIPEKFRPLAGRLNVVVSASLPPSTSLSEGGKEGPIIVPSIQDALTTLQSLSSSSASEAAAAAALDSSSTTALLPQTQTTTTSAGIQIARVFIIGGAQLYNACLALPQTDRILLTRVRSEFDCDVFFPVDLPDQQHPESGEGGSGWKRVATDEWAAWTGEGDAGKVGAVESEKGVEFEFGMWVRR